MDGLPHPKLRPMATAPRDGTVVVLFRRVFDEATGRFDPTALGQAIRMRVPRAGMEGDFVMADIDQDDEDKVHWAGEQDHQFTGWCTVEEYERGDLIRCERC